MANRTEVSPGKNINIADPEVQRELLFAQEPRILEATASFANKIRSFPPDPKYPDIEPRALMVGGFVRDSLLGLRAKDADIEVYGVSAPRLLEALEQLFPGQINKVGQAFEVIKVSLGEGLELDISLPRRESQTGPRHKDVEVHGDPGMSVEEAARRRDFTINALAADILEGRVIDSFGGIADLEAKRLRVTDPERFLDDPLRVYRAVQFVGRYGFLVEQESLALLGRMVAEGKLDHLAKERVTTELGKLLLKSARPSVGLELARGIGLIEKYFPELADLEKTEQEPDWHPEGNVWTHTLMALDAASRIIREPERNLSRDEQLQVMLGVLCHDLGKPATTEVKSGKVRSHGHEEAGVEPTKRFFGKLSFTKEAGLAAETIAKDHLKPGTLLREFDLGHLDPRQYANAVRRLIKRIAPISPEVLVAAAEADSRGRALPDALTKPYLPGIKMRQVIKENRLDAEASKALIQGRDIIERARLLGVGLEAGPIFGEIIRKIEALRDEGVISTKEEALAEADKLIRAFSLR